MQDISLIIGFVLTLMVYSYLIRDNVLYRIAVYAFVGLTAGYITIVTFESVLVPWFNSTVGTGEPANLALGVLPVLLGLFLALKPVSPRLARLGNLGIAVVIGVGAAVAVVGAVSGTLVPLAQSTADASRVSLIDAILILIGVVCSLIYFQYLGRRTPEGTIQQPRAIRALGLVGQGFIVVTLGALYGSAILTSLTIFSERLSFLLGQF